jgi:hypothetical protein
MRRAVHVFPYAAGRILDALSRMQMPDPADFDGAAPVALELNHPGGVGEVLLDPDGGEWMRARPAASGLTAPAA